jgi:hypothetical protein
MESCITNRLNSLCVLYCNLEKKVNEHLSKNEVDSTIKEEIKQIKGELSEIKKENDSLIKGELSEIKKENDLSINRELQIVNGELQIINIDKNNKINDELDSIKNTINSITRELRYQKNINLESTPNYLEYTLLYADFENCGICMYCPSDPYEPDNDISIGPIIDNEKYTILKNILNN